MRSSVISRALGAPAAACARSRRRRRAGVLMARRRLFRRAADDTPGSRAPRARRRAARRLGGGVPAAAAGVGARGSRSFSSSTIRSDVFLPTPGIAVSRARSPRSIARISSGGSMPESTASATFGPIPLTRSAARTAPARAGSRTRTAQRILAHVRVDAQRDVAARLAETVERRQRHEHVVADAADVDDDPVRLFVERSGRADARSRRAAPGGWRQLG